MENHARLLARELEAAGWTVHVLTTPVGMTRREVRAAIGVSGDVAFAGGRIGRYDRRFFEEAPTVAERLVRIHGIPVIHAQGLAGPVLWRNTRIRARLVTTIHGTLWSETPLDRRRRRSPVETLRLAWQYKHRFAFWPLWRRFLAGHPRLIVDSVFTADELKREVPGVSPLVVPLGVGLPGPLPARDGARRRVSGRAGWADDGAPLLVGVGRIERIKGYDVLVGALDAGARGARLVVVGDGPDRPRLEALVRAEGMGERVFLAGRVDDAGMADFWAAADGFVNPDQGQPAFGLVNAEALLRGVPVLASDAGAHGEVVRAGDGCLVDPPDDRAAWVRALGRFVPGLPEPAGARQDRARRARIRFAPGRMTGQVIAAYERLAGLQ